MTEVWFCELCSTMGSVEIDDAAGVWSAIQRILEAHRQNAPNCEGGRWDIHCFSVTGKEDFNAVSESEGNRAHI